MLTKPLPSRDVWLSFYMQLFPGISWGLVPGCMLPTKLDKIIQQVYERALPFLSVNCKIKKEWRTLPEMYQGLVLPNFPLVALSAKVFLLENWGFSGRAHSDALAMAYENFIFYGGGGPLRSPFSYSYEDYGHLSMKETRLKNLWLLTHTFKAELVFHEEDRVTGLQEGNRPLMSEFFCVGYRGKELEALNVV